MSKLQSEVSKACISTLKDANKAVDLAIASLNDTKLNFPYELMTWEELGVLSVSDASFANEEGMKSQQGRCHFLTLVRQLKRPGQSTFKVYPIAFSSTAIKCVAEQLYNVKHRACNQVWKQEIAYVP